MQSVILPQFFQMIARFNSIYPIRNSSKFYFSLFYFFSNGNGIHFNRKRYLCVGVYSNTVEEDCIAYNTFVSELQIRASYAVQKWHKNARKRGRLFVEGQTI